jgi:membrane protein DedA with SNARE-associated domain
VLGSTASIHVVHGLIATVFDPCWNVEHQLFIWSTIITVLFFSGVGLPLPEDIPLSLAGFTAAKTAHDQFVLGHFAAAFVMVAVPILLGDLVAYGWGRRLGLGLRERIHLLRRILSDKRLARVQHWFDRYGAFTVFLGRQVAGVRFVTFFTAGSMRVPVGRFVLFDFLGCLVSVPVWLTVGFLASRYGQLWLDEAMKRVGRGFMLAAAVVALALFVVAKARSCARDRSELRMVAAGVHVPVKATEPVE